MSLDYARQKLRGAVEILSTNSGTLQKRLSQTYVPYLVSIRPDDDLTEEMQASFTALMKRFHTVQNEHLGTAAASALAMSDSEASETAQIIFDLFCDAIFEIQIENMKVEK